MGVQVAKGAIDLGIVTRNAEAALKFYRDTLGFDYQGDMPMPGGATMHRLMCGESMIKIVELPKDPPAQAAPGGINGATGYRYWTITVTNMSEVVSDCEKAGYKIAVPETEFRPGIKIAMIEDPDGNWVELLSLG